jgi:predicted phosphodiesterase
MRVALFSDLHGNIVGLQAVLARIDQLGGADVIFALGDFLAVGPGGDDLLDMLIARQVRMIRGNWDEIFIDLP